MIKLDYKTHPLSRQDIRLMAKFLRKYFKECVSIDGYFFDSVKCLELIPTRFKEITVEICEDKELGEVPRLLYTRLSRTLSHKDKRKRLCRSI